MTPSLWKEYEQELSRAVRTFWESLRKPHAPAVEVFGLCINDAGEGILPHVITREDMDRFALEENLSLEQARLSHLLDSVLVEHVQTFGPLFEKANELYLRIEPDDKEDEDAWEKIALRHERTAIRTLQRLSKEGLFRQQNPKPLLMLHKTAGLSSAESEAYLTLLNDKKDLEALWGPEPEPLGDPMLPCGPAHRSVDFKDLRLSPSGAWVAMTGWNQEVQIWKSGAWDKPAQVRRFQL